MTTDASDSDPGPGEADQRFLILMRHAKSDWSDASLADHDRTLNGRGRRDAPRMAQWLSSVDMLPDRILSSSSVRTRETVQLMMEQWSDSTEVVFDESIYLASPDTLVGAAQSDGGDAQRLMVLAHNPGMAHLVSSLSGQHIEMPTAAIAIFRIPLPDWNHLSGASVPLDLIHYMRPKAL